MSEDDASILSALLMRGREMSAEEGAEIEASMTSQQQLREEVSEALAKQLRSSDRSFKAFVRAAVAYFQAEQARIDGNTPPVPGSPRATMAQARQQGVQPTIELAPADKRMEATSENKVPSQKLEQTGRQASYDQDAAAQEFFASSLSGADPELIGTKRAQAMIEEDEAHKTASGAEQIVGLLRERLEELRRLPVLKKESRRLSKKIRRAEQHQLKIQCMVRNTLCR